MPVIKQFSGPNAALLWLLARRCGWGVLQLCIAGTVIGVVTGISANRSDPDADPTLLETGILIFCFVAMVGRTDWNSLLASWYPTHSALPVTHRALGRVDLLFFVVCPVTVPVCYLIGFWIVAPWAPVHAYVRSAYAAMAALWILAPALQAVKRGLGFEVHLTLHLVLVTLLGASFVALVGDKVTLSLEQLVLVLTGGAALSYTGLRWAGPKAWRPDDAFRETGPIVNPPPQEARSPIGPPFSNRAAAQTWFILRRLEVLLFNPGNWVLVGCATISPIMFIGVFDSTKSLPMDLMAVLGVFYLVSLYYVESVGTVTALPHSLWARTLDHCRVLLWGVSGVSIFGLLCFAASQLQTEGNSWAAALWLPWVAWAAVALAPVAVPGILAVVVLASDSPYAGASFAIINLTAFAVMLSLSMPLGNTASKGRARRLPGAFALVGLGLGALHLLAPPPALLWIAREILCGALVLALLHHNTATDQMPARAAWRIAVALGACVCVSVTLLALLGAPATPGGVAEIFLGLGVVAPVFLPLVWIPHAIAWAKRAGKRTPATSSELQRALWEDLR